MKKILALLFLISCGHSGKVILRSFPDGAQVSVKDSSGNMKSLGPTPLTVAPSDLGSGTLSAVIFSKEGFLDQHLMLVRPTANEQIEVTAKLQQKVEDPKTFEAQNRQEKLAQQMVSAHHLIGQKRYAEAENILASLTREFPNVSVSYDLLGNIAYLQKDLSRALNYYQRSLSLNPENTETRKMIHRLKGESN